MTQAFKKLYLEKLSDQRDVARDYTLMEFHVVDLRTPGTGEMHEMEEDELRELREFGVRTQ